LGSTSPATRSVLASQPRATAGLSKFDAQVWQRKLAVARRLRPDIEWRQGDAAALPFGDGSFDAVLCQSALMFFPDRAAALREMARVAAAGGTVAVQVWDLLEAQEGYRAMYARSPGTWARRPGSWAAPTGPRATWSWSGRCTRRPELDATPLAARVDRDTYRRILDAGVEAMGPFVVDGGRVELPIRGTSSPGSSPAEPHPERADGRSCRILGGRDPP
jgi:SAM-dependent methyltransferase